MAKHDYEKKLMRLISILKKLNDGEALSVRELASEHNVSTRTIQRDFNDKLIHFFPIYQENKKWKMEDGYKIEKSTNIEEILILDIMEEISNSFGSMLSSKAKKLLNKIKNDDVNPIYTRIDMENIENKLPQVLQLENAIKSKHIIFIKYDGYQGTFETKLKPLKIANFEGFWYLIAVDIKNNKQKKYTIQKISNINITEEIFESSQEIEEQLQNAVSIWFNDKKEPFNVKLFIDKDASSYIKRKPISPTQIIESIYEDGSIDINLKVTSQMEVMKIIKSWIPHIKVIEPKSLDDKIKTELENYIKEYY